MKAVSTAPLLLLALMAAGCGHREHPAPESLPPVSVRVATVESVTEVRSIALPGTVRAVESAALAPKVMGTVQSIAVTLGQTVKKGDVLVKLSANEIAARLAQAETGLNQAQRDLAREQGLLATGASAQETVRSLEDRVRLMQATVDEARTMLAYTAITAPFDGVIVRRHLNEGDLAAPGQPILEIENPGLLEVHVEVPDGLASVPVGAGVDVVVGPAFFQGRVAEVSPALDAVSRTFLAKISLPASASVRSGQFARVGWPAGEGRTLAVPEGAVTPFGQMERVFVEESGRAVLRLVRTGARRGGSVEILSGLSAGERVVSEGSAALRDGQPLEVRP